MSRPADRCEATKTQRGSVGRGAQDVTSVTSRLPVANTRFVDGKKPSFHPRRSDRGSSGSREYLLPAPPGSRLLKGEVLFAHDIESILTLLDGQRSFANRCLYAISRAFAIGGTNYRAHPRESASTTRKGLEGPPEPCRRLAPLNTLVLIRPCGQPFKCRPSLGTFGGPRDHRGEKSRGSNGMRQASADGLDFA